MREADRRAILPREEIQAHNRRVAIEIEIRKASAKEPLQSVRELLANWNRDGLVSIAGECLRRLERIDRMEGR